MHMRIRMVAGAALGALLAACTSTTESDGTATGTGALAPIAAGTGAPTAGAGSGGPVLPVADQFSRAAGGTDRVFFGLDQHRLDPDAAETARRMAAWLVTRPSVTLVIEGHADERGTREYNLALGARRA